MDRNPASRPNLVPWCVLVSTSILCLHGNLITGDLRCVSDFMFTINCSLTLRPSENTSYWLSLLETSFDEETYVCYLNNSYGVSSCSVRKPSERISGIFTDMNTFEISLCHKQDDKHEKCEVLDEIFKPAENIKPNAPCCLTVTRNSSQHRFAWRNTYEQCAAFTELVDNFQYQLHYYKSGDHNMSRIFTTYSPEYSVGDEAFVPDSEYAARVRSSPNQVSYKGQWSDWSSEVRWKAEPAVLDPSANLFHSDLGIRVFIAFCLMVPLVLLVCYAPVKKWKQNVFIPTPAPYFHTLYSGCHGDFRAWVITQGNTADMLKAEETLQIDTLTKSADVSKETWQAQCSYQLMEGSGYSNIPDQICDVSIMGVPYAVSNMAPLSQPDSSMNLGLYVQTGSPAEGDSGCWLCSDTSLEKEPPWYCNDYCTLSTFQQSTPVTAEHHGSL